MPLRRKTKQVVIGAAVLAVVLLAAGFVFVSYFMHAVYETESLLGPEQIPPAVRESLAKLFPGAEDVGWEFEDGLYEAEFRWRGRANIEAHFQPDGQWAKTVSPVGLADLPEKARVYLAAQAGYTIKEEERIEQPGAPLSYEAKLANQLMEWNCQFDAAGNLIARTRDGPVLE